MTGEKKKTYMLIEERCSDRIHTVRTRTTRTLNRLVKPCKPRKRERIVRDSTHDPVRQCLIHGITKVVEEVERSLGVIPTLLVVDLGDVGTSGECHLPCKRT